MHSTRQDAESVSRLWAAHLRTEFPCRLRGEKLAGVDLVLLDADIAGCVVTWRAEGRPLDEGRRQLVNRLLQDLDRVLPPLSREQERAYYQRLRQISELLLEPAD